MYSCRHIILVFKFESAVKKTKKKEKEIAPHASPKERPKVETIQKIMWLIAYRMLKHILIYNPRKKKKIIINKRANRKWKNGWLDIWDILSSAQSFVYGYLLRISIYTNAKPLAERMQLAWTQMSNERKTTFMSHGFWHGVCSIW